MRVSLGAAAEGTGPSSISKRLTLACTLLAEGDRTAAATAGTGVCAGEWEAGSSGAAGLTGTARGAAYPALAAGVLLTLFPPTEPPGWAVAAAGRFPLLSWDLSGVPGVVGGEEATERGGSYSTTSRASSICSAEFTNKTISKSQAITN
jgi:hypothetical protein